MSYFIKSAYYLITTLGLYGAHQTLKAQVGNYAANGSFESVFECDPPYILNNAINWSNIGADSSQMCGGLLSLDSNCFANAPNTSYAFQYPASGKKFGRITQFCITPCAYYYSRGYPKNRLRANLIANRTYCVKMLVCLEDASPYAISNFGFYFGDMSTDTIKYANGPITYLNPQVKNPINNVITDTLNWVPITGTFVATGNEKYLIIGNFESNASTTMSLVLQDSTLKWSEYFVDDVSCIELNLPAYAGHDKSIIPGDSVYIGRESDFAIDPGCVWYKLPNTTTAIDTSSGIWVKPMSTATYVVKQTLDCSTEKWDTVVVFMNMVGLEKYKYLNESIQLFPSPAKDFLEIKLSKKELFTEYHSLEVYNNLGQLLQKQSSDFKEDKIRIDVSEFKVGVYFLKLLGENTETIIKRFVVAR